MIRKQSVALNWAKNLVMYEVNLRQFSPNGTFSEFESHLPRLKELGVGILWFMPIQPIGEKNRKGSLGSYYSIRDYWGVNPMYGCINDFKRLVAKAHSMGMYVLLDWVANHTSWDSNMTVNHPEFYTKDEHGNFRAPYPEWADVIHLDYSNPELREYMIEAMKFWVRETDIDGFRCDMAHLVTTDFWNQARVELEKVKPLLMLAESENLDLAESAFDILYGWRLFHLVNDIAQSKKNVYDLDSMIKSEIVDYPPQVWQLLFTSNHDENSWNGSAIERLTFALEPINVLMLMLSGMPLIYSGQEAGNYRRLHFFDKDQIEWKDDKLTPFYTKLADLRKRNPAIWTGSYGGGYARIQTSHDDCILAFMRQKDNYKVLVVMNLSHHDQTFVMKGDLYVGNYLDIFSLKIVTVHANTVVNFKSWEYLVYEFESDLA